MTDRERDRRALVVLLKSETVRELRGVIDWAEKAIAHIERGETRIAGSEVRACAVQSLAALERAAAVAELADRGLE